MLGRLFAVVDFSLIAYVRARWEFIDLFAVYRGGDLVPFIRQHIILFTADRVISSAKPNGRDVVTALGGSAPGVSCTVVVLLSRSFHPAFRESFRVIANARAGIAVIRRCLVQRGLGEDFDWTK